MIAPKNLAGGMEFLVTVGVSAVAGLLAFLLVMLVVSVTRAELSDILECADLSALWSAATCRSPR